MRAKRLLPSFEDAPATPPSRGFIRTSGSGVRWRLLLVIVAGALAFLALWGSASTVLFSLMPLYWLSVVRIAKLQPGITSALLVPG